MWHQIHEMLHIEKGGEDQIADELDAYNPLVPKGRDLTATMMIEIEDPVRRDAMLKRMGWIDEKVFLVVGDRRIAAEPTGEDPRRDRLAPGTRRSAPLRIMHSVGFGRFRPRRLSQRSGVVVAQARLALLTEPGSACHGPPSPAFLPKRCARPEAFGIHDAVAFV